MSATPIVCLIATCGGPEWADLARERAYPSTHDQGFSDVVMTHLPNGTVETARNMAAAHAGINGGLYVFLDADDELAPGYVDALDLALSRPGDRSRALYAPRVAYIRDGVPGPAEFPNRHQTMPPLNHCVIGTAIPDTLFWEAGAFREGYGPWEDYELFLRCIAAGATVDYVFDAVYLAHVSPDSRSSGLPRRDAVALANRIHAEHRVRIGQ